MTAGFARNSLSRTALIAVFAAGCLSEAWPQTPPKPGVERIVAVDALVRQDGAATTLSFVVSHPVEAKATLLEAPDRIVLDFPEINFQFDSAKVGGGDGLIRSFRYGLFAKGRSRIVIDLVQPAEVKTISLIPAKNAGAHLMSIILGRIDRSAFQVAAQATRPSEEPAKAGPKHVRDETKRVVVIDPGHGGVDPGAQGKTGLNEKDVVFDFAKRLREKLQLSSQYRIILTREEDIFVSLGERVRIARLHEADLFISLHADALPRFDQVKGATIYTASARASDPQAARVAEKENKSDLAAGLTEETSGADDVADILADLARRETRALSQVAAAKLVSGVSGIIRLNKNPQRGAGFKVLSAPDVPSLLLELGYLSSPADVENFTSEEWKDKAVTAVAAAVEAYFAQRLGPGASSGLR